jgi:hypothetical protein
MRLFISLLKISRIFLSNYMETKASLIFRHWIMENRPAYPVSYEVKDSRGTNKIPFREIKAEQIDYAEAISGEGVLIRVQGANGEPDYVWLANTPAYFVLCYPRCLCLVSGSTLALEIKRSKVRHITASRAKELAVKCVDK